MDVKNMKIKEKMLFLVDYFKNIICNTKFWISNNQVNKEHDKILNQCIDNFDPEKDEFYYDGYVFCFVKNNLSVWVQNYPYAYGSVPWGEWTQLKLSNERIFSIDNFTYREPTWNKKILPKRYTRLKLHRFLIKILKNYKKES